MSATTHRAPSDYSTTEKQELFREEKALWKEYQELESQVEDQMRKMRAGRVIDVRSIVERVIDHLRGR